jgi:hypothetical protein
MKESLRFRTVQSLPPCTIATSRPRKQQRLWPGAVFCSRHFKDGKPADEAFMSTCFPCHNKTKPSDFVFTRYAP